MRLKTGVTAAKREKITIKYVQLQKEKEKEIEIK